VAKNSLRLLNTPARVAAGLRVAPHSGEKGVTAVNPRSIGPVAGVLATIVLALAPQAQARDSAKFKVLSISGTESFTRDVVYARRTSDPAPSP